MQNFVFESDLKFLDILLKSQCGAYAVRLRVLFFYFYLFKFNTSKGLRVQKYMYYIII